MSNKTILDNLKKRLEKEKDKWTKELQGVLRAYKTTKRQPTGETPFSLPYHMEAVIPTELEEPTLQTSIANIPDNEQQLTLCLELLEEKIEKIRVRIAAYHLKLKQYYNKKVKNKSFQV